MATYTSNYGWTKPSGSDNVDISVLNDNLDDQDSTIHDAFLNMAPPFSESSTYAVDDIVLYGTGLYKCHTAVVTPGSWTGSTNWQVYKLSEGGGGTYADLPDKPSINGNELSGNKTTSDLGIDKNAVGLGNVPNVATNDQEPTFIEASTRNNIASGEKLSVIFGKIQKFFNDLKTVAFSGSYADLSNKPSIPTKTSDITNDSNFVSDANYVHTDNNFTTSEKTKLAGIASGAEANVQANWSQTNTSADDFIKNKPNLATVATSGSYADLSNKPENANTFQGTIAEWNQLTTAEKKAYDHASITGTGGGEYNVDKSTGDLVQTSGMPSEYPASQVIMSDGVTSVKDVLDANPLSHNGIYTGRNLGVINSNADWLAFRAKYGIADKSYKGLYLGDYVKVNDGTYNADWMVAGFNTETNKGNTNVCPKCVSMIPRVGDGCGTSYMNSNNVTTGGYVGSYMHATKLPAIATKLTTIFGSNLVTRDILASNTVTNGYVSNWEWVSCKCSLLTSVQVYGSLSFENTGGSYYAGFNIGEGCEKLPVFNYINPVQFSRSYFWLRGVHSTVSFCYVSGSGSANSTGASNAQGVRPLICLN